MNKNLQKEMGCRNQLAHRTNIKSKPSGQTMRSVYKGNQRSSEFEGKQNEPVFTQQNRIQKSKGTQNRCKLKPKWPNNGR